MLSDKKKQEVLRSAQQHLHDTFAALTREAVLAKDRVASTLERIKATNGAERSVQEKLLRIFSESSDHVETLCASPYFMRCDVRTDATGEPRPLYFAKQSCPDLQIYSWITPAARLRFASIGQSELRGADGTTSRVGLVRKDQFMTAEDRLLYMTSEAEDYGRTLIFQDYFSRQKRDFVLTDIVAKMEQAQDDVIRAEPCGSLLISGPAGSGKTTLALHRLAYLAQSPETSARFSPRRMLVLVQDASAQAYFSHLLPDLGLHGVLVTTFSAWAREILDIDAQEPSEPLQEDASVYDQLQFEKNQAIKDLQITAQRNDPFRLLERIYAHHLSLTSRALFKQQCGEKSLDRFDLTALLLLRRMRDQHLYRRRTALVATRAGKHVTRTREELLQYSCIVVDETQNYLAAQIDLLRSCIDPETDAMLYIGDLAQQTKLCTMRAWSEVGETFPTGRHIALDKTYRNTKQILDYARQQGFPNPPTSERNGEPVTEVICTDHASTLSSVRRILSQETDQLTGVLTMDARSAARYRTILSHEFPNVHFMSAEESQGVEFSRVCLILSDEDGQPTSITPALAEEQRRIQRDRLYVALTRAMDTLVVLRQTESSA